MISKFMKPPSKSQLSAERASSLKELLKVEEDSPVFSRNARNNVEHLDERIDLWIETGGTKMLECVFDSRQNYDFLNRPSSDQRSWFTKRVYLIADDTFLSAGRSGVEEINMKLLMDEVRRIKQVAECFLKEDSTITRLHP